MATDDLQASGNGFRRQVTFRIGPEDAPLLEVAARAHGGISGWDRCGSARLRRRAADREQATQDDTADALADDDVPF